jgi:hypothetical protein
LRDGAVVRSGGLLRHRLTRCGDAAADDHAARLFAGGELDRAVCRVTRHAEPEPLPAVAGGGEFAIERDLLMLLRRPAGDDQLARAHLRSADADLGRRRRGVNGNRGRGNNRGNMD